MSENKPIQLGLCCLNTVLRARKPPIYASRKMVIKSIEEKGIDALKEKIRQNLEDVLTMMDWNEENGVKVFRLSSELFPHKSNPKVEDYSFDFAVDLLQKIGEKSKRYNQRLTFHPGQYNVVGTPSAATFKQTVSDLKYHADVLDLIGADKNSIMVVHGGGVYGDKQATIDRWCKQFALLPANVRGRLVIENCEKCFSIEDCLQVSRQIDIPVVFDTHHFECYNQLHPDEAFKSPDQYIPDIIDSWKKRGIKPKFHVSEQGDGKTGNHSDFIETIPNYLLEIPEKYGVEIDIMIEAKMKEQAIFRLYEKYPWLNCKHVNTLQLDSETVSTLTQSTSKIVKTSKRKVRLNKKSKETNEEVSKKNSRKRQRVVEGSVMIGAEQKNENDENQMKNSRRPRRSCRNKVSTK